MYERSAEVPLEVRGILSVRKSEYCNVGDGNMRVGIRILHYVLCNDITLERAREDTD